MYKEIDISNEVESLSTVDHLSICKLLDKIDAELAKLDLSPRILKSNIEAVRTELRVRDVKGYTCFGMGAGLERNVLDVLLTYCNDNGIHLYL